MSKSGKQRKRWTAAEKLRLVLKGLEPGIDVAALCLQEGLSPTQYYAWKKQLIDEEVAMLRPSSVYRILQEADLMNRQRGRDKRYRAEHEKATQPDQIWATDLICVTLGQEQYF
jgi:transposase-like protein